MISELFSGLSQDFGRLLDNADDYNVIIEIGDGPNVKKFQAHSVVLRARSSYFHTALSSDWSRRENGYIVFKQLGVSPAIFSAIINGTMSLDDNDTDIFELLAAADQFSLHELLSWRKEDFSALQKTINRLIPLIRLFQMTPADYCHKVRPYKRLLSKNLQEDLLHYYLANDTPKSTTVLPPRVAPIQIDSVLIGPQHTALIARWIDNESVIKQGSKYNFLLLFRASRDGYSINALKQKCADKGPVMLVLKIHDSGRLIGGYNSIGWKTEKIGPGQGASDSFVFTLGDGRSPDGAKIARMISTAASDKDIDDLAWNGPRFGKGPDLWVCMNNDQSGEARKVTYESSITETEGRFRWIDCEIFSVVKK
ncbi:3095_t:CDS:2 [Cetraspora pellucida]|uniref:Oxidation resistance protein 1 n=1 Tax=Cetraspora pellucida TaxID=1433469 RepID=A0A9N9F4H7_9GLOM|nr:3095_t:CDS:2 [Cetraspora pellucida]